MTGEVRGPGQDRPSNRSKIVCHGEARVADCGSYSTKEVSPFFVYS